MKEVLRKGIAIILIASIFLCGSDVQTFASIKITIPKDGNFLKKSDTVSDGEILTREEEISRREQELLEKERVLDEREKALDERERALDERAGYQENTSETGPFLSGDSLVRIGNVTEEQVSAVQEGFKKLPQKVREIIITAGYRVEVTDEDIELLITGGGTNSWYGASAGYPLYVILIANNQTIEEMSRTIIHESGHALANTMSGADSSELWLDCYATEGKTLYHTAEVTDASEWFCECFVYFLNDPEYLKIIAPKSYQYLDTYLNQVLAK